ncbi:unnamed protein product [Enterobius vermicularis]|uniref:Cpw-wpc domain-containing protein n=1 Tax=Enterobius vermicularis TaxID=51028 RepID=A0A0N4UY31_ENTVE|nr:unnamed protein product [Enterobius vermicularis]
MVSFNHRLGLSVDLDYSNGTEFANKIYGYLRANVTQLLYVCKQRRDFYLCMRDMYSSCVNQFYLLSLPGTTLTNVLDYVRVLAQLDFMCNAGFEEVVNQYGSLLGASNSQEYQKCQKDYGTSMGSKPEARCSNTNDFMKCAQQAFSKYCENKAAGWWICEDLRLSYANDCPDLRCNV